MSNLNKNKLLVIGVDPGITTAYAILDLNGGLVKVRSSRLLNLSKLIEEVYNEGRVVVIGTDVRYSPKFVYKLAAKLGAKIISPKEDMKVGFKQRFTSKYKIKNDHERDALSAALYAYQEIKPILEKVDRRLNKENKELIKNEVKEMVIKGLNIKDAVQIILTKPKEPKKRKRIRDKTNKINRFSEENILLQKQNKRLKKEILVLRRKIKRIYKSINLLTELKTGKIIDEKNNKIKTLKEEINNLNNQNKALTEELKKTINHITNIKGNAVIKKLNTLNLYEVISNIDKIEEDTAVFVNDPNIFSKKAIEELRKISCSIIYEKKPSRKLLEEDMNFIDAKKLNIENYKDFIIVKKRDIEMQKQNLEILSKIIKEYQRKRREIKL